MISESTASTAYRMSSSIIWWGDTFLTNGFCLQTSEEYFERSRPGCPSSALKCLRAFCIIVANAVCLPTPTASNEVLSSFRGMHVVWQNIFIRMTMPSLMHATISSRRTKKTATSMVRFCEAKSSDNRSIGLLFNRWHMPDVVHPVCSQETVYSWRIFNNDRLCETRAVL